jgi:hypothetical protein
MKKELFNGTTLLFMSNTMIMNMYRKTTNVANEKYAIFNQSDMLVTIDTDYFECFIHVRLVWYLYYR